MDDDIIHNQDDISVASSIPTDISISEISDLRLDNIQVGKRSTLKSKKQQQKERDRIARQLLEKKQLEHDLQLVKIELNQKDYLLENAKTDYKVKLEELEEKLHQCKHQKQILIAKSESQISLQRVKNLIFLLHYCMYIYVHDADEFGKKNIYHTFSSLQFI